MLDLLQRDKNATEQMPAMPTTEEAIADLYAQIRILQQTQWSIIITVCLLFLVEVAQLFAIYGVMANLR